jgi:hypothetical protein
MPSPLVLLVGVLSAAAAVVLPAAGPAGATPAQGAEPAQRRLVLRLTETSTSASYDDRGTPGPSVGDRFDYTTAVRDAATGAALGTKQGRCVSAYVGANGHLYARCGETFELAEGRLSSRGVVDQTALPTGARQALAVAGRSGAYAGRRGREEFAATRYPDEFTTTVTLR